MKNFITKPKLFLLTFFIIALFINKECYSQNIVPNASFEIYTLCPGGTGGITYINSWVTNGFSPDYFNLCASSCMLQTGACFGEKNFAGNQMPYDGNGYAGLVLFSYSFANGREYLGVMLTKPLSVGIKYFIYAYISRGNDWQTHGACNNFGFHFYTYPHDDFTNMCPMDNFAQVVDTNIITDSLNWTRVSGSFIADSAYTYLAMGNFFDDAHTDTLEMNPWLGLSDNEAYYYVDFVCVSEDSLWNATTDVKQINNQKDNYLYPNPTSNVLFVNNLKQGEAIQIRNALNEIILSKFSEASTEIMDITSLKPGVYFISINGWNQIFIKL